MVRRWADGGWRRTLLPLGHGPEGEEWRSVEYGPFELIARDGQMRETRGRLIVHISLHLGQRW